MAAITLTSSRCRCQASSAAASPPSSAGAGAGTGPSVNNSDAAPVRPPAVRDRLPIAATLNSSIMAAMPPSGAGAGAGGAAGAGGRPGQAGAGTLRGWPSLPAASVLLPLSLMPPATPLALQPLVFPDALVAAAVATPYRAPPGRAVPLARPLRAPPSFPPALPRRRPRPEEDEEEEEEEEEEEDDDDDDEDQGGRAVDRDTPGVHLHGERHKGLAAPHPGGDPGDVLGAYPVPLPYGDVRMDEADLDADVAEVMAVRARHPDGPWERIDVRQAAQRRRALRRMTPTQRDYFLCGVVAMMEAAEYAQSRRLLRRRRLHQYVRYHYDCGTPIARELFLDLWGFGRKYFSRIRRMVRDLGAGPAPAPAAVSSSSSRGQLHHQHDLYDPHPPHTAASHAASAAAMAAAAGAPGRGLEATMPRMPPRSRATPNASISSLGSNSGGGGGGGGSVVGAGGSESTWDAPP